MTEVSKNVTSKEQLENALGLGDKNREKRKSLIEVILLVNITLM